MAMILLHLLQSKSCLQKLQTNHKIEEHKLRSSSSEIWGYGVLSTSIIALTAFGGILALPFVHGLAYKRTLLYLAGLAIGTLAGSSLFFLIPEALELTEHEMHRPGFVWNCLFMVIAIYTSFIIERVLKMIKDWRERCKKAKIKHQTENGVCIISLPLEVKDKAKNPKPEDKPVGKDTSKNEMTEQDRKHINAVAWMVITGDALHNFIDGVSVGAAFTESVLAGVSVSVAIFCEELPHELGKFSSVGFRLYIDTFFFKIFKLTIT
ncbi:metal cation symporter ZIP14-like [Mercenaria mercenaria]|uniref:metal cation symporter ZIP14-like n=1 Tax=Mercenaria mercenaria TaxID=6596 RepID=UPI00234EAC3E|nr:metal cation symporter ZIP14-like [Mercenaria mercenaria]